MDITHIFITDFFADFGIYFSIKKGKIIARKIFVENVNCQSSEFK